MLLPSKEGIIYFYNLRVFSPHLVLGGSKLNDRRSGTTRMLHITCHAGDPYTVLTLLVGKCRRWDRLISHSPDKVTNDDREQEVV